MDLFEHIDVDDAGNAHEPWLEEDNYCGGGCKEVIEAIVFVGETEYGPVPQDVEEEDNNGERVIDARTIV